MGGTGTVSLETAAGITDSGSGQTLTIATGVVIQGDTYSFINLGTDSLDNVGTINGIAPDNTFPMIITATNWVNHGKIEGPGLTGVTLAGSWTNAADGQIIANVGTVSLTGTWSNAGTIALSNNGTVDLGGTLTLGSLGTFNRTPTSGGTVNLTGTLNLTGATLDASTGPWTLDGGKIVGGTVTDNLLNAKTTSTLQDVTLAGTLTFPSAGGGAVSIVDVAGAGLTLAGGTVILSGTADELRFAGTQVLGGTGTVNMSGAGGITDSGSGNILTIALGVTVQGGDDAFINVGTAELENLGTISGNVPGDFPPLTITGTNWVNHGKIEGPGLTGVTLAGSWTNAADGQIIANVGTVSLTGTWSNAGTIALSNNGTVDLGGTLTLASLGTVNRTPTSGGTVNLTGTLNLTGATLDASTGPWTLDGGKIVGGTVTDNLLNAKTTSTLQDVTLAGTLTFPSAGGGAVSIVDVAGAGLTLAGGTVILSGTADELRFAGTQVLGGTGTVNMSGAGGITDSGSGNILTIALGVTVQGGDDAFINVGTAELENLGTISGNVPGDFPPLTITGTNWVNEGTVQGVNDGGVALAGTWTNQGIIQAVSGGSVHLGPDDLTGSGSFTNHGTITGVDGFIYLNSTLNNAGSTLALSDSTGSWYIEFGEILGGTVTTSGNAALIATKNTGTLAGVVLAGTLTMATPLLPVSDAGKITVTGGLTLSSGSVNFSESAVLTFAGTQTLGGTGTVTFSGETGNNGIAVSSGATLTISSGVTVEGNSGTVGSSSAGLITNQGTIEATGGGTLTAQGYTNFAGGTLTGGTWSAVGASALRLVGTDIATNAAHIVLDGASEHIYDAASGTVNALAGFASNAAAGSFTIQNGANYTTAAAFTNSGTLTINSGVTFAVGGTGIYTQTGGTTVLNSGTLGTTGNQIEIEGGSLSGTGTVDGNLTNAALINLGSNPGTLTVEGNYSQTSAGILFLKVGGAVAGSLFDQVDVTGTAALNGTLRVSLINGFAPDSKNSLTHSISPALAGRLRYSILH